MIPFLLFPFFIFGAYSSRKLSWIWAVVLAIISCAEIFILYAFAQRFVPGADSWKMTLFIIPHIKQTVQASPWICIAFLSLPCVSTLLVAYIKQLAVWAILITHVTMTILGLVFYCQLVGEFSMSSVASSLGSFAVGNIYFFGIFFALFGIRTWFFDSN